MSKKPSIDEQIEAVALALKAYSPTLFPKEGASLQAALTTLRWLKANPEVAKLVYHITKEFPGATVNPREEE
jgi:hypothetical protein